MEVDDFFFLHVLQRDNFLIVIMLEDFMTSILIERLHAIFELIKLYLSYCRKIIRVRDGKKDDLKYRRKQLLSVIGRIAPHQRSYISLLIVDVLSNVF